MKDRVYQILETHDIALRELKHIDISKFSSKRTLSCVTGIDVKGFYNIIFIRDAKSRFLKKEFETILEIYSKIRAELGINFKKQMIFYSSDICSKTQNLMEETGFKYDLV